MSLLTAETALDIIYSNIPKNERLATADDEGITIYAEAGYHGFIFYDGSIMQIDNDHRMLDISLWSINRIITYHIGSDNWLFLRIFDRPSCMQFETLSNQFNRYFYGITAIIYDLEHREKKSIKCDRLSTLFVEI